MSKYISLLLLLVAVAGCTPLDAPAAVATGTAITPTVAQLPIPSPTPPAVCAIVTAVQSLHVRSGPGTDKAVIAYLAHDDQVMIIDQAAAWWKIRTAEGMEGWSNSIYLKSIACGG